MPRRLPIDPNLRAYYGRPTPGRWLIFWAGFTFETFTRRRLSRVVKWRLGEARLEVKGLENLPEGAGFVLAANHYHGWPAFDVVGAVFAAASRGRPDVADRLAIIVGRRERVRQGKPPIPARLTRRLLNFAYQRWSANVERLPLGNQRASIQTLREWRSRARQQPTLVFPEGKARLQFGLVRPGAGRWCARLGVPVVPVGVWYYEGGWQVRIGKPIEWARRAELHDVQLGLAIADLLPPEIAPRWQNGLAQWRAAHEISVVLAKEK